MAEFELRPTIVGEFTMRISEGEARALAGISNYATNTFVKAIYDNLGTAYAKPYEKGLRQFYESLFKLHAPLARIDDARAVFSGRKVVADPKREDDEMLVNAEPAEPSLLPEEDMPI